MTKTTAEPSNQTIELWPIGRLVEYPRNPRKNDSAVDRMCESIREFGFKIPCLVRSDGEVVDGHLRLKAARKLGITEIPVILCDEWAPAQVKAFRLMVNRSVTWADWDEELLALELQEIQASDFDLSLTGFDPGEIDGLLALEDDEIANAAPPLPETPASRLGDLWLLGPHRVLCGDATSPEVVARLLGDRKPRLMVTDPPYGIELDSEWRDRAGLNGHGPAEPSYMKKWRSQTGRRNCESWKAKRMLRVQGRIKRLEQVLHVNDHESPSVHEISFIDGDGTIAGTMVCSSDPKLCRPYIATPGYEEKA